MVRLNTGGRHSQSRRLLIDRSGVRRVKLPTGGWWDIRTRPTWQDASSLRGDECQVDDLLAAISEAWSFDGPVSVKSIGFRDESDLAAVLVALQEDVLPWLDQDAPRDLATGLFAAMSIGQVPEKFFEIQLMAATGWSWQTLQSTPADVVLKMALFLGVSDVKEQGGSMRFPEDSRLPESGPVGGHEGGDITSEQ